MRDRRGQGEGACGGNLVAPVTLAPQCDVRFWVVS